MSASNTFDFDLLAEYNPPAPGNVRLQVIGGHTDKTEEIRARAWRPVAPGPKAGRPPYTGQSHPAPVRAGQTRAFAAETEPGSGHASPARRFAMSDRVPSV